MADETQAHDGSDRSQGPARLVAIDALRGLIMVLMALDHANHFVAQKHPPSEIWDGVFPIYYDPVAFWTRFVTHFCAPGFFLLMGVGMALLAHSRWEQGWSRWAVVRHFLVRGAVILALKLLLVNRAWELSPGGWGVLGAQSEGRRVLLSYHIGAIYQKIHRSSQSCPHAVTDA